MNAPSENVNVSRAEAVANLVVGHGTTYHSSAARAVLLRMPLHLLAEVDELANKARKSRNIMIAELLGVALEAVRQELPADVVDELDKRVFIELAHRVEQAEIVRETYIDRLEG